MQRGFFFVSFESNWDKTQQSLALIPALLHTQEILAKWILTNHQGSLTDEMLCGGGEGGYCYFAIDTSCNGNCKP